MSKREIRQQVDEAIAVEEAQESYGYEDEDGFLCGPFSAQQLKQKLSKCACVFSCDHCILNNR
jgi:hypothetical protein